MSLHPSVLILGDKPNPSKNLSLDVAFVGTSSYKTLLEWVYRMDLDFNLVFIENAYDHLGFPRAKTKAMLSNEVANKVITLGANAENFLVGFNKDQIVPLPYFNLPHPSGLNRELNDKKKLNDLLTRCRAFVYGKPGA